MASKFVTVFGGSGFLGRRIVEHLAAAGHDVRVGVRHPDRAAFLRRLDRDGRIELVQADVWDEATVIEAHFVLTAAAEAGDTEAKHLAMFARRASRGQCFHRPYLGTREWAADFAPVETAMPMSTLPAEQRDRDLGWMLHDIDFAKGVRGTHAAGAALVTFNLETFESYGKTQGANAPISIQAAFAYSSALNALLAFDSRRRIRIGEMTVVFWADVTGDVDTASQVEALLWHAIVEGESAIADTLEAVARGEPLTRTTAPVRDGVRFALLHSLERHAPCGFREIDLRPSRPAGLVRAHGREDEKLEKQSRANPSIRRAHGRQSTRHLAVRQSTVVLNLCRNVGHHLIQRRATRIVLAITQPDSPSRDHTNLVANPTHRLGRPLTNSLQDIDHVTRFDVAHAESAQLGINIEFKRPSPALLALLTSPLGPPQPNDVFHGLGKSRNNAVAMRTLVYEGVDPIINKLAVA